MNFNSKTLEYTKGMTANTTSLSSLEIMEKILSSKGNFVKAYWKSNPTTSAAYRSTIKLEKVTSGVVRAGIDYGALSSVKEGIESGERGIVQSLPWGSWKIINEVSLFPYVIEHKGVDYIRLYPSASNKPKSTFYVNDEEVDKKTFAQYLTPSESRKLLQPTEEDIPLCFTVKADNILGTPEDFEE